eukprot:732891-Rhodomonas_salina.1
MERNEPEMPALQRKTVPYTPKPHLFTHSLTPQPASSHPTGHHRRTLSVSVRAIEREMGTLAGKGLTLQPYTP